jgi:hypothetical protein
MELLTPTSLYYTIITNEYQLKNVRAYILKKRRTSKDIRRSAYDQIGGEYGFGRGRFPL